MYPGLLGDHPWLPITLRMNSQLLNTTGPACSSPAVLSWLLSPLPPAPPVQGTSVMPGHLFDGNHLGGVGVTLASSG